MWKAVWGNLIVLPDEIEETDPVLKRAREAGLEIARGSSEADERARMGQIEGTIISLGGNCFEDWLGDTPKEGDKVVYNKFSGFIKEIDGVEYRIIRDTDIYAVRRES